jgi:hypothetical protein
VVTAISIVASALALVFAWWEYREAAHAKSILAIERDELPQKVANAVRTIVNSTQSGLVAHPELEPGWAGSVDYLDVNADGERENLVQYPSGAHGCMLKILGWHGGQFQELAYLGVGTPVGFEFGDFDRDGKIEIRTQEIDWSAGLPYATAPRLVLLLRWDGTSFIEVSREKLPLSIRP